MAINMISVKCPDCGATLDGVDSSREHIFCSFCGARVIIQNDNEYVYRHIDEAGVKQAETDRIVELRRMELAEKEAEKAAKNKQIKILISIILGAVGILMMLIGSVSGNSGLEMVGLWAFIILAYVWLMGGINNKNNNNASAYDGKVAIPDSATDYENKSYQAIEMIFRSAGFTNVICIPLNDLTTGLLKKPNMVESVTVGGAEPSSGDRYFPNVAVVISYHSFAGR